MLESREAFCLYGGLGPVAHLTFEGEVLVDGTGWDGQAKREASEAEAIMFIAVAADRCRLPSLLALLPRRPEGAWNCTACGGSRFAEVTGRRFVCQECGGLGWLCS